MFDWLLFTVLLLVGLSLWLRVQSYRSSINGVETKVSPISLAVQDLVATSGGIYVAIIALTSFLKLDMPDKVSLLRASVDPLALSAIGLAVAQPIVIKIFNKIVGR